VKLGFMKQNIKFAFKLPYFSSNSTVPLHPTTIPIPSYHQRFHDLFVTCVSTTTDN